MGEKRFIFHSSCFLFIPSLGDKGRFPGQNTNQPFPLPTPTPTSLGGLLLLGTPSMPGTPGDTNTYLCTLGIISLHSYFWGPYAHPCTGTPGDPTYIPEKAYLWQVLLRSPVYRYSCGLFPYPSESLLMSSTPTLTLLQVLMGTPSLSKVFLEEPALLIVLLWTPICT